MKGEGEREEGRAPRALRIEPPWNLHSGRATRHVPELNGARPPPVLPYTRARARTNAGERTRVIYL